MQYNIAMIGEKDIIYVFGMLGMNVFYAQEEVEARQLMTRLIDDNYGVIFITEGIAELIPDVIRKYDDVYLPAIILIPGNVDSQSIGLQRIQEHVKRAVGQNIL